MMDFVRLDSYRISHGEAGKLFGGPLDDDGMHEVIQLACQILDNRRILN